MALRNDTETRFESWPEVVLARPNNPDGGEITSSRIVSDGAGPFDFTSASSPSAVTISIKSDDAAWVDGTIDITTAADTSAVTVAELVTAITTAAITNLTAEAEADTGYLKLSLSTPGTIEYFQVKGEVAELTGMGYGYSGIVIGIDTQQSVADEPNAVDSARIAITDAKGRETAVVTDGYTTGETFTLTDTAADNQLKAIVEGGLFEVDSAFAAKKYLSPTVENTKPTLTIEIYYGLYTKDDNQETNLAGYLRVKSRSVKGSVGGIAGDRNLQAITYNLVSTSYQDPLTGVKSTYREEQRMTVAEYNTVDRLALDYRA